MSKKKLLSVAVIMIAVAILSYSTLAWFQAKDEVTNKFTISDSLSSFDVDVWEKVTVNGAEQEIGKGHPDAGQPTHGTLYEKILPNEEYLKTVHVTNSSGNDLAGQYIKVEVTFTNYSALKELGATGEEYDCTGMLVGANFSTDKTDANADWWYDSANVTKDPTANTATYTFYLKSELANEEDSVLFEKVKLPATMDIGDVAGLKSKGFEIQVVAYAIQSANLKSTTVGATDLDHAVHAFTQWDSANP